MPLEHSRVTAVLAVALALGMLASVAQGATSPHVVSITLQDPSVDPSKSGMWMKTDTTTVKAGRITFEAVNLSKDLVHEVLVVPALPAGKELPYDAKTDTVVEKRAHSRGEISELKPGARGKVTLNLKPGTYILLCNQPGHYKSGMSTKLVVEK
jgi:uncharacterized cupredoxin-like copper-binding protein